MLFFDSEEFEDMVLDAHIIADESVFTDSAKSKNSVWIVATHSDILINKRIYTSNAMKDGAHTFVKPFKKPVLVHHDDKKDAIGRVQESYYFHKEDWKAAERLVGKDMEFPENATGAIVLRATIPDKDAWEKVQDGRYHSVSVGFQSAKATCNICGKNWADGKCRHTPGSKYNSETMYLVVEDMNFKEVSFINTPADAYASAVSSTEPLDLEEKDTENHDADYCITTDTSKYKDSQEEKNMDFEQKYNELLEEHNKLKTIYKKDAAEKIFKIKSDAKIEGFDAKSKDEKIAKYIGLDIDTLELLKEELASFSDGVQITYEEMKKILEAEYEEKKKELEELTKKAEEEAKSGVIGEKKTEENESEDKKEEPKSDKESDTAEPKSEEKPEGKTDTDDSSKDEKETPAENANNADNQDLKKDAEADAKSKSNISINDPNGVISNTSSDRPSVTPNEMALKQLGIKR